MWYFAGVQPVIQKKSLPGHLACFLALCCSCYPGAPLLHGHPSFSICRGSNRRREGAVESAKCEANWDLPRGGSGAWQKSPKEKQQHKLYISRWWVLVSNKILSVMFTKIGNSRFHWVYLVLVPAIAGYNSNDARLMVACRPSSHYVAQL